MAHQLHWWQNGLIYQILVPSFQDSNGDGIGDLRGVISHLDYLRWLGASAIWLSPIYASPLEELGYDVTDLTSINPQFGNMDDFDELVKSAHDIDIKVILDWVPNHTSDQHPWFVESRSSRENPKRDWYIWRDGKEDGTPPNNWISVFGGSEWQWDDHTGQFYLHTFLDKQPDLNWRNPDVEQAMFDTLRFWLNRGVDGFRIDATCLIMKDEQFRDNPPNPDYDSTQGPDSQLLPEHTRDQPGIHDMLARMRSVIEEFGDDRMLAGELYLSTEKTVRYYGDDKPELHLPLNLQLAWSPWDSESFAHIIDQYERQLPPNGWPTWTASTHDAPRIASRTEGEQTRVAAMLLLTLRGTPTHYYGEEIGMRGVPIPPERAHDPQGRRTGRNRDPERTPMQWNNTLHAGFSSVEPWLPIADDFQNANVASQAEDPGSILTLYRRLISLRQSEPILLTGRCEIVERQKPLLAYQRIDDDRRLLVLLNFGKETQTCEIPDAGHAAILLSTFLDRDGDEVYKSIGLHGDEGVILELR